MTGQNKQAQGRNSFTIHQAVIVSVAGGLLTYVLASLSINNGSLVFYALTLGVAVLTVRIAVKLVRDGKKR